MAFLALQVRWAHVVILCYHIEDLLDGDPGLLAPGDGVGQVPAVHRDKAFLVQAAAIVQKGRLLYAPGQPDVILAAGAVQVGRPFVAVHPDHVVAFAPPTAADVGDAEVAADVLAAAFGGGDDVVAVVGETAGVIDVHIRRVHRQVRSPAAERVLPAKLSVEVAEFLVPAIGEGLVVDVVVERDPHLPLVAGADRLLGLLAIVGAGLAEVAPDFLSSCPDHLDALQAQVEVRTAEQKAAVADYGRIGARAFSEVENALSAGFNLAERVRQAARG